MYPRNAASPPPLAIGEIRLVADGTLQTADASVRVKTGTGKWGAGGGTLACDATSGVWVYTPTQAETNAESFIVAIYKASCTGCAVTIVTTASATAGRTVPADGSITADVIAPDAIDADSLKADAVAEIKTALEAAGGHLALILEDTSATLPAALTSILGYVDCLPASWTVPAAAGAEMALTSATITTLANAAAAATETEAINDATGGAFMQAIANKLASVFSITDLGLTAIGGAVVSALGTGSGLTALATATGQTTGNAILAKIDSAIVADGDVYQFTSNALERAPGGSTSVSVTFTPVAVTVSAGAITDNAITQYQHAAFGPFVFTIVDSAGAAVDLSASSLTFVVYLPGSESTVLWQLTTAGGEITIGGASNNQVTVTDDGSNTAIAGVYRYVLWDTTNDLVRARGTLEIVAEADVDTT